MNDTPFPPPTPEPASNPSVDPTPTPTPTEAMTTEAVASDGLPSEPAATSEPTSSIDALPTEETPSASVAVDHDPGALDDPSEVDQHAEHADADDHELVSTGAGRHSSARRTRLAIGAVGLGGLLAVSGWLALAGDGHADDTDAQRAGVADVSDTSADEQLDATSQIDVDVDDDATAGADGADGTPGSDGATMPTERGGNHGGAHGGGHEGGRGQQGQMGQQGMGASAATPSGAPTSGSGGS